MCISLLEEKLYTSGFLDPRTTGLQRAILHPYALQMILFAPPPVKSQHRTMDLEMRVYIGVKKQKFVNRIIYTSKYDSRIFAFFIHRERNSTLRDTLSNRLHLDSYDNNQLEIIKGLIVIYIFRQFGAFFGLIKHL